MGNQWKLMKFMISPARIAINGQLSSVTSCSTDIEHPWIPQGDLVTSGFSISTFIYCTVSTKRIKPEDHGHANNTPADASNEHENLPANMTFLPS